MKTTLDEKVKFLEICVEALNNQLSSLNYKIVFDYDISDDDSNELSSSILTLLNDEDLTLFEHETTNLSTYDFITDYFIDFIKEVNKLIDCENNTQNFYIAFETDIWNTRTNQRFMGVFNSKIKALLEVQIHFSEIIYEDSGFYKPIKGKLDMSASFDAIDIEEKTLNEIN